MPSGGFPTKSSEWWMRKMREKLSRMLEYAQENVPFYRDFAEARGSKALRLEDFPPIQKKDIIQNPDAFISEEYSRFPLMDKQLIARTSGSTGTYLKIHWDRRNYIESMIETWLLRKRYYGILPQDKQCGFFTTIYEGNKLVAYTEGQNTLVQKNKITFNRNNLDKEKIEKIYKEIYAFDPKWMMLQPSNAMLLAQCIEEKKLPKLRNLQFIELNGETLFENVRQQLKQVFECVIANLYGCAESNTISYECPNGHMHICKSGVHIEILDDVQKPVTDGTEGNIYITTFCNHAMPFIRYNTGDKGRILKNVVCECGNKGPVLELTAGRANDYAIDRYGEKVLASVFVRPIEFVNERIGQIINQFQVIQRDIDHFTVKLVVKKRYFNWQEAIKKMYLQNLWQDSLKDAKFNFEFYTELLPDSSTGKLAYFVRKDFKEKENG